MPSGESTQENLQSQPDLPNGIPRNSCGKDALSQVSETGRYIILGLQR